MANITSIVFDCERMKYPNTGLFSFCNGLGEALYNKGLQEKEAISFYVPAKAIGIFGSRVKYVLQKNYHKLIMPPIAKNAVWHVAHQQSDYFPKQNNRGIVLTVHDLNFLYEKNKTVEKRKTYLRQLQQKIDRSDSIVTVSHFTAMELEREINLKGKKPIVVHNGVTIHSGAMKIPKLAPNAPFIFSIGTVAQKKNFHVLPNLLVGNDMQLIIAGEIREPNYKMEIINCAKQLGVVDRVYIIGGISEAEKNWYYKHCMAFAFPSLAEGFGLPVIEAMHFGKQVMLSRAGSLPEVGGSVANYFNSFSQEDIQVTLAQVLAKATDENTATSVLHHAEQFTWEHAANNYWKIYQSLLG